jgi:hypothetical protein
VGPRTDREWGCFVKAERLEREFASRRVPANGGLMLFEPAVALALIDRAAEEGVPILGVDGCFVTDGRVESPLSHTADFSAAVAQGHGCWADAEAFIRERGDLGLVFEVGLGDDPVEVV